MNGHRYYHTKSEREWQVPYDITHMWNLRLDTNELIYEANRLTDIEHRLVVAKGVGEGWTGSWGLAEASYYTEDG